MVWYGMVQSSPVVPHSNSLSGGGLSHCYLQVIQETMKSLHVE